MINCGLNRFLKCFLHVLPWIIRIFPIVSLPCFQSVSIFVPLPLTSQFSTLSSTCSNIFLVKIAISFNIFNINKSQFAESVPRLHHTTHQILQCFPQIKWCLPNKKNTAVLLIGLLGLLCRTLRPGETEGFSPSKKPWENDLSSGKTMGITMGKR